MPRENWPRSAFSVTDADIVQQALDAARFRAVVDFNSTMQSAAMSWTA
jgi:hypothetical protein